MARAATQSMFTAELLGPAIADSFRKLDPRTLVRNPVMFVTAVVALLVTFMLVAGIGGGSVAFKAQLVFWLWLTVLFGNFAEALAEGRGKAQAASLRATKSELAGKRVIGSGTEMVAASALNGPSGSFNSKLVIGTSGTLRNVLLVIPALLMNVSPCKNTVTP